MLQNAHAAMTSEARTLLTADVQLDSGRPSLKRLAIIDRMTEPVVQSRTETIESPTMARPADSAHGGAMMIELKGIDASFPLLGNSL